MKKLLILVFALIFALSLSFAVYAEETLPGEGTYEVGDVFPEEALGDVTTNDTADPEENPGMTPGEDVSMDTVLDRVIEWWELRKEEIQSLAGFIISVLFALFGKRLSNKITNLKADTNLKISETSKVSNGKIDELVEAYNRNAEASEQLCKKVDILIAKVDEVDRKTVETEEIEVSIAKMLDMAYSHSRLPNGTKDVINTEYAQIERKVHGYPIVEAEADEKEN